jgi:hypothetical protein
VPAARIVAVFPETVQMDGVVEVKVTVSPELAVALRVIGPEGRVTLLNGAKVIVCDAAFTVKLRETGVAAA